LRHALATRFIEAGVTSRSGAAALGQSERTFSHYSRGADRRRLAADAMEQLERNEAEHAANEKRKTLENQVP
jgi:hypothetical protein